MAVISNQEARFTLNGKTRGLDTMDKEVKKVSKSVEGVEKKMKALTKRMKQHTEQSTAGWGRITKDVVGAIAAYQGLYMAYNMVRDAAKFEQQEASFRKLAASFGTDANSLITDLKRVAVGTLSTKDVMTSAGKAMLLGIPVEKLSTMMQIARSSSRITGQTVQEAFEDISIGLGRQSKMILDNLGIVFKTNEAYDEYAKNLNKTASQLTDAEKKQAFMNAALKAGEDIVRRVGAENLTLAEKQSKAIAALSDLRIQFSKLAVEIMSNVLPSLESLTNGLEGISVLIKDMLGDLEKNGDKAHDMGVAYQNARIRAEKLGKQIKKLKEEQGFTEKDAQIKVLRQQEMVWLKLQNQLMKDVRKEIKKTKEAEAERAAQKQGGGENTISVENLRALDEYKAKTVTVNRELAAATFNRIQKEVVEEAKGMALNAAAYLAHVKRIKAAADKKAAAEIAATRQTASALLEIAKGNSDQEAAIRDGLNVRLEQIDIKRLTFIKSNTDEILAARQTSQDSHIADYKNHLQELANADKEALARKKKELLDKKNILTKFEKEHKKLTKGSFDYGVIKLHEEYKAFKAAGADKILLEEWYDEAVRKLWDENTDYFKSLEDNKTEASKESSALMEDAIRGSADIIKGLWDSSYRSNDGIEDIFKNGANAFIDSMVRMEIQAIVTGKVIQVEMAAATAGLSVVLGLVGMFVGSLFGGSGEKIKSLAERLKEVFDGFIDKFGNSIEDFRLALMTKEQRIAEFNNQNVDIAKELKQSFERIKFVTGLQGNSQNRISAFIPGIKWRGGGDSIPDTLIEKWQTTGRTIGEVLEQERQYIADRALDMKSIIEKRYRDESELIKGIGNNIKDLIARQKEWGKSLDADITKIQRDGLSPVRMLELARGDVNALEKRLSETGVKDHEGRVAVLKDLKAAYNELYQAGKNALIDSGGHKTVEFEVLKAEVIGGLQRIKEEGTSEFEQMINVQRDMLEAMTGTRDASVALNILAAGMLLALKNLFELGTGATTEISPYVLDSFPGRDTTTGPKLVPPKLMNKVGFEETASDAPVEITLNFDSETFVKLIIPGLKEASRTGELTFDVGAVVNEGVI